MTLVPGGISIAETYITEQLRNPNLERPTAILASLLFFDSVSGGVDAGGWFFVFSVF